MKPFFLKASIFMIIFSGFLPRLYLVWALPIWHDEAYSLWASQLPILKILTGAADPVHLPGYYLFLKIWTLFENHLFLARISSLLFFAINGYLLSKIASMAKDDIFSLLLVFLYTFSGYFLIFDWQVRMYTAALALILLSLFFLSKNRLFLFTIINTIGVYFDYAFWWYFAPLTLFFLYQAVTKKKILAKILLSIGITSLLFLPWLPFFLANYPRGLEGIDWMKSYISPFFTFPFLLGTHSNYTFFLPFFIMAISGLVIFLEKKQTRTIQLLLFSALCSFVSVLLCSLLFSPIFHLRSLQIVALGILFLYAFTLDWLYKQRQYCITGLAILLTVINFFFVLQLLFSKPGQLLISFFPWRNFRARIEDKVDWVVFRKTKELPTPLLLWGLEYTLDGKESLFAKKIPYQEVTAASPEKEQNCQLISSNLLDIYGCQD